MRRPAYSVPGHLRAALALLLVAVLGLGIAYPLALVGFGELVDPEAANGSLTYFPNGTVNSSHLLPPNTTATVGGLRSLGAPAAAPALSVASPPALSSPPRGAAHLPVRSSAAPGPAGPRGLAWER
ncbi:MAG: potassium-transporting ATPase subunit C [Thermoplasmata archaeon]